MAQAAVPVLAVARRSGTTILRRQDVDLRLTYATYALVVEDRRVQSLTCGLVTSAA